MNEIGKYISKIRQERNLTQKELADRMHLHVTTISKWENGNSVPNLSYFEMLAKALDITTAELFEYGRSGTEPENGIASGNETAPESGTTPDSGTASDGGTTPDSASDHDDSASCNNNANCNRISKYIKRLLPILVAVILLAAAIAGIAAYKANSNELKYKIVDEYLSEDADYFGFNNVYHIVVRYEGIITDEFLQNYHHELRKIYTKKFQEANLIRVFFVTQYTDDSSTLSPEYELMLLPIKD